MEITLLTGLFVLFFLSFFLPESKEPSKPKDSKKDAEKLLIEMKAEQEKKRADLTALQTLIDRGHFDPP